MYKMCRDCSWRDQEKIRAVTNTTLFETDEGIVFPDSIEKWPWEFEQKGGDK